MSNQDQKDLSKALTYANWSVVGLVIPFIGWLLAGMSLSFIKTVPVNEHTIARLKQVKRTAWVGIIISSVALSAWGGLYRYNVQQTEKEQQAQQEVVRQSQLNEKSKQQVNQAALQICLDDINKWYNDNSQGLQTDAYWDRLLELRQQQVDECQLKYQD